MLKEPGKLRLSAALFLASVFVLFGGKPMKTAILDWLDEIFSTYDYFETVNNKNT